LARLGALLIFEPAIWGDDLDAVNGLVEVILLRRLSFRRLRLSENQLRGKRQNGD
jgi:hypothetical protein